MPEDDRRAFAEVVHVELAEGRGDAHGRRGEYTLRTFAMSENASEKTAIQGLVPGAIVAACGAELMC